MAHSKLYRNFIILQEDEKKHSGSGDKALSGYAKIEAKSDKCKISFYAQNLKKEEKYSLVLICYKKDLKQVVELGSLNVSESGKGESSKEYYIDNIAGLDLSYEKISGAAICKHKDNQLIFLMYGFINGENIDESWKKCKVIKDKSIKEPSKEIKKEEKKIGKVKFEEKQGNEKEKTCSKCELKTNKEEVEEKSKYKKEEEKDECKVEEKPKHKKEEKKDECEVKEKPKHKKEQKEDEYEVKKEHKTKDCTDNCKREEDNKFESYERMIDQKRGEEDIHEDDFRIKGTIGDFFMDITKGFEEVKNVSKEISYCKWYKVRVNTLDDMCNVSNYNKYTVAYYPMLNNYPYIKKYGYFMLGYKCDSEGNLKYIVYGVPGKKDKDEQPYAGKTGFVTWMSNAEGSKEGCWLMFYDYKNSMVVVPMK